MGVETNGTICARIREGQQLPQRSAPRSFGSSNGRSVSPWVERGFPGQHCAKTDTIANRFEGLADDTLTPLRLCSNPFIDA
jgi:hypothetical protein